MKDSTIKSLGFTLNIKVPSSVEEFDQLAKRQNACLDEATSNILYRSLLAQFRDAFCEQLEAKTGVARLTKMSGKNNDVEVWDESEADYCKRVAAEKGVELSTFKDLADQVAAGIEFDPSAPERKAAGPKKLAKVYLEVANNIISKGGAEKAAAKLTGLLGRTVGTSLEELAAAIKEDQDAKKAKALNDLMS